MAVLGWLGCAAVLVAWAGTELSRRVWDYVNRTEVLAVIENAETESVTDAEFDFDPADVVDAWSLPVEVSERMDVLRGLIDANQARRRAQFEADALAEIERLTSGDAA